MIKKKWTSKEDNILINIVTSQNIKNISWKQVSLSIPYRNGKQCRERWYNVLDPNINNKPWTEEEIDELYYYQDLYGNKWAKIASHIPKSQNNIKHKWFSLTSNIPPPLTTSESKTLKPRYSEEEWMEIASFLKI